MARAESLVSDVLSFYSFDGNDTLENDVAGNVAKAGSKPSLISSKSNRIGSFGSPQVCILTRERVSERESNYCCVLACPCQIK